MSIKLLFLCISVVIVSCFQSCVINEYHTCSCYVSNADSTLKISTVLYTAKEKQSKKYCDEYEAEANEYPSSYTVTCDLD